jgi:hypothetical protein
MMTGTYARNSAQAQQASADRAARIEAKRAALAARLEALKGAQR